LFQISAVDVEAGDGAVWRRLMAVSRPPADLVHHLVQRSHGGTRLDGGLLFVAILVVAMPLLVALPEPALAIGVPLPLPLLDWGRADRPPIEVNIPWLPCTFRKRRLKSSVWRPFDLLRSI